MEEKKIISRQEVQQKMRENLAIDRQYFNELKAHLKHGQKDRLLEAMAAYPMEDIHFENEPELETANIVSKRISDTLVAIATEVVVQSMIEESVRQQQQLTGESNESTEE